MPGASHDMKASVIRTLAQKTGRDLDAWIALIRFKGPRDRAGAVLWLKNDHGLGHVTAQIVASEAFAPRTRGPEVPRIRGPEERGPYAGAPAELRPILDEVNSCARGLGSDVQAYETRSYVAFRRKRQFAVARPGSGCVDLGLAIPGHRTTHRLRNAKGVGSKRISHVVTLERALDVDREVRGWLREAYDRDGSH